MLEEMFEGVNDWLLNMATTYGYLGIFAISLISSSTIILPIPAFIVIMSMGSILNPVLVALVGALGASIGELTGYALGRTGRHYTSIERKVNKAEDIFKEYGLWSIFVFSVSPLPFDVVGIVSGILKVNIALFFFFTFLGRYCLYLILAFEGANAYEIVRQLLRGEVNLFSGMLLIVLTAIIVVTFMISKKFKE